MFYRKLRRFLEEERAQDLIEYTLLLAFVALVSAGLMSQAGSSLRSTWGGASSTIAVANGSGAATTVTSPPATSPPAGGGDRDH